MKPGVERPMLYPPMKTPRGWHIVYQPDYRTPNIFNLNERAMFTYHPPVQRDYGARILASEDLQPAVQYMDLADEVVEDPVSGKKYPCINRHGLISLNDGMEPDPAELKEKGIDEKMEEEIRRVRDEWISSFGPDKKGGKPDVEEVKRALKTAVARGKAIYQEWLVRRNISWISPFIPRMIHAFRYGIYQRVTDTLYMDYCQRGGDEPEQELIRKINLFIRIYESDGLMKPNGTSWLSEDELWDCWVAFSGSESEAERTCATIEAVLLPLREEIEEELKAAA